VAVALILLMVGLAASFLAGLAPGLEEHNTFTTGMVAELERRPWIWLDQVWAPPVSR
jgi:hypothetical protein